MNKKNSKFLVELLPQKNMKSSIIREQFYFQGDMTNFFGGDKAPLHHSCVYALDPKTATDHSPPVIC